MVGQGRGNAWFPNVSDVTIARFLPDALTSHVSASDWTQFCDTIDEALSPIGEIRREIRGHNMIVFHSLQYFSYWH